MGILSPRPSSAEQEQLQGLIRQAEEHVHSIFREPGWESFTFHSIDHTQLVFEKAEEWSTALKLDKSELQALQLAALFHDVGYRTNYTDHETEGQQIFTEFARSHNVKNELIESVNQLIRFTRKDHRDHSNLMAAIMHDIDRVSMGMPDFIEIGLRLKSEWEHFKGLKATDREWYRFQVEYLERTQFKTAYGRSAYGAQREENLLLLKKLALT